jgi:dihydrofolate reductase
VPRRIRYQVAVTLDGFIADPNGGFDWIPTDPEVDFTALFEQFDTFLMGRGTYETMVNQQGSGAIPGKKVIVFSKSLKQKDHPDVMVVAEASKEFLDRLKNEARQDIWLFGGGALFRSLLEIKAVDTIELAIMPVLLGAGIPFLPSSAVETKLRLTKHEVSKIGRMSLSYDIEYTSPRSGAKGPK